jgi:hypothetical protein
MGKKGNALAIYLMVFFITFMAISLITMDYIMHSVGDTMNTTLPDGNAKDQAMILMAQGYGISSNVGDYLVIIFLAMYYIGLIIYNYRVAFTPGLLYVQAILFIITMFTSGLMVETFAVYTNTTFNQTVLFFPKTVFVMNYLPWFVLAGIGVSVLSASQGGKV